MARAAIPIRGSVTQAIEPVGSRKQSTDVAEYLRVFHHVGFFVPQPLRQLAP